MQNDMLLFSELRAAPGKKYAMVIGWGDYKTDLGIWQTGLGKQQDEFSVSKDSSCCALFFFEMPYEVDSKALGLRPQAAAVRGLRVRGCVKRMDGVLYQK